MGRLVRLHDRYLIRGLAPLVGFAFAGIALLYVVLDLMQNIDDVAEHMGSSGLLSTVWLVLAIYAVRVAAYACEFGPGIFLVGAGLHAVSLARENEFVGLLASGVSMKRSLAPALVLAGLLALATATLRETPLPVLNRLEHGWTSRLHRRQERSLAGALVRAGARGVLIVDSYDPEAGAASGFVWSEGGRFVVADQARWQRKSSSWAFPDGGKVFDYEAGDVGGRLSELKTSAGPEALEFERLGPQVLSLRELGRVGGREARTALHARLSDVLSWIILVGLGLPVVVRYAGRSALTGAGLCLLFAGAYELTTRGGISLASGGALPVWLGVWGPRLAFGGLAGVLYAFSDRG